jgi:hypothetical protein
MVLAGAEGLNNTEIAARLGVAGQLGSQVAHAVRRAAT